MSVEEGRLCLWVSVSEDEDVEIEQICVPFCEDPVERQSPTWTKADPPLLRSIVPVFQEIIKQDLEMLLERICTGG